MRPHIPRETFSLQSSGVAAPTKTGIRNPSMSTADTREKRLTAEDAQIRARQIYALRRRNKSHREIADFLGIKICTVSHYLNPRCRAALRAGLRN